MRAGTLMATAAAAAMLAGCGGGSPPEEPAPVADAEARPPPPPPPGRAATTGSREARSGQAAGAGGQATRADPCFPDGVIRAPAWAEADAPYDLAEFFRAPSEEQNAAPLYLDAFFEFDPDLAVLFARRQREQREPIAKRRKQQSQRLDQAWREDPESVAPAAVDALLADHQTGFEKLALAQQRPQCVFQTGLDVQSLLPHLGAARQVARVARWRTRRDLVQGDLQRPVETVSTLLRLSRDLRPRGLVVCQLTSIATDNFCCRQMIPSILRAPDVDAPHCDRLLAILKRHQAEAIDPFLEGQRAEYFVARKTLHDLRHRTGAFDPESIKEVLGPRGRADSLLECIKLMQSLGGFGGSLAREKWGRLNEAGNAERLRREIDSMTAEDWSKEGDALSRVYATILGMAERTGLERVRACSQRSLVEPLRATTVAVFLAPVLEPVVQAFLRAETTLRATACLIALRRWQLLHPESPPDLEAAVRGAGLQAVPLDPYCDRPLRMAVLDGQGVVYSVGKDGRDDRARVDWQHGRQPGDFIFRLAPGAE